MGFILQKCRKTIYWAVFFAGMFILGIQAASAFFVSGYNVGILCGPPHYGPTPINVGASYRFITTSMTVTALKAGTADRKILRHYVVVKSILPNGNTDWTRALQVQSLAVAEVDLDSTPPSYSFPDSLDLVEGNRTATPANFLSTDCLSTFVANSGNQTYLLVAAGTTVTTGGDNAVVSKNGPGKPGLMTSGSSLEAVVGKDKTVLNVSVLNLNNGNLVRTFKIRSKAGKYFLVSSSGIFDIDNDFNDELVLVYVKFIGDFRYDYIFEHYNIATGALERTTTTTQYNQVKFQR